MQIQIECNNSPYQKQSCCICNHLYEMTEAKVIVCNDQGKYYGEVCPECLKNGFNWLSDRFDQITQVRKTIKIRPTQKQKVPVSA